MILKCIGYLKIFSAFFTTVARSNISWYNRKRLLRNRQQMRAESHKAFLFFQKAYDTKNCLASNRILPCIIKIRRDPSASNNSTQVNINKPCRGDFFYQLIRVAAAEDP
jgi:hypothetical protein